MLRPTRLALACLGAAPAPNYTRRTLTTEFFSEGYAVGDLNSDGRVEIVTANKKCLHVLTLRP